MTLSLDKKISHHSPSNVSNLVEILIQRAKIQSDRIAYTFLQDGETNEVNLTYQELDQRARAISAKLQDCCQPGDRALLLYPSGIEFIEAFFGCLYAGVVAIPAYPPRRNQNMSRLEVILKDAQAKVVLTTESLLSNIQIRLTENPELTELYYIATNILPTQKSSSWQKPELNGDTLALLQYTSGSTGTPKGVMVTHDNIMHNERMIESAFGHTADTIFVGWLPLFHDMGLVGNVLQPMYLGIPCILMSPAAFLQKPIRWLQAISRYKATTSGGPNFAYNLCVQKVKPEQLASLDLSSWELAFNGSEPIQAETLKQFASKFAICGFRYSAFYSCYGMAETTLLVSGGEKNQKPVVRSIQTGALEQNSVVESEIFQPESRELVGCGCPNRLDNKVIIVEPNSLTRLGKGQVGEIWISGQNVASGYWNRPQMTKETFQAYLTNTGEGPFLRTGDLGFLQDGELFVTGRLKDVIIIRGQNHYPQDLELTVENSHPALRRGFGAAFALELNGSERLVIVQEIERSYLRKLDIKEIAASIRGAVTAEHSLQVYATALLKTGSIPKTSSGKIQRHACKAGFLNGNLNVVEDWSETPQGKVKFLHLQKEVDSMLANLSNHYSK